MIRALSLSLLVLSAAACDLGGGSGKGSGGGGGSIDADPAYADSPAYGIPCGQILDCYYLCDGDEACATECYEAADPEGQVLHDELETCWIENDCLDRDCALAACPDELAACESQTPEGGEVCLSEGVYEVCDSYGACYRYSATGVGWGSNEEFAGFWSVWYCNLHMNNMLTINAISAAYVGVVLECEVTSCEAS